MVSVAEGDPRNRRQLYLTDPHKDVQCWGGGIINSWLGYSREAKTSAVADRLDYLTAVSVLIPVRVFEDVGLFDERYFLYWEDADFSFRLKRHGWKLTVAGNVMSNMSLAIHTAIRWRPHLKSGF